ncbi:hypothetical protein Pst134EA_032151 [Puccinia striiformis f. sp. tritici]|uniref:uncharacterized protein n=1 Tax=Puccinia striiformis f. sp. tritici TaxID=168172 RepID=UPI002007A2A6|nr:uncharacterized protein Pst134EA_032151 [Puccinia striiformis f. sp. tritici]KAH9440644.1 hypothetical protein Pst134EA_032151 [Puccinia striiformis f. sp. tritici]
MAIEGKRLPPPPAAWPNLATDQHQALSSCVNPTYYKNGVQLRGALVGFPSSHPDIQNSNGSQYFSLRRWEFHLSIARPTNTLED